MNKLTPDELAIVAREVTGQEWQHSADESLPFLVVGVHKLYWIPTEFPDQWKDLVEWIPENLGRMPGHKERRRNGMNATRWRAACFDVMDAIRAKDITALQRMVLELKK